MLRMLLRKIDLTSEKIGQWWRNLKVVSMSLPQQQIGFKQSRKLYLNLWSRRWLKPNLSLANNFILVGLWQLKVLFEDACINCKMLFWKKAKLSELLILLSRLFHSITEFLKNVYLTLYRGMLSMLFLVLYAVLVVGILSNRYLGDWLLGILKK